MSDEGCRPRGQGAKERLLAKLRTYADMRKDAVVRGLETPALAGLLTQKYGYGLCDAFDLIFEGGSAHPTYRDVDEVVAGIDPQWRESSRQRWAACADISLSGPRPQ